MVHKKIQEMLDLADERRREMQAEQAEQIQAALDASGLTLAEYALKFALEERWTHGYDEEKEVWWMKVDYRMVLRPTPEPEPEIEEEPVEEDPLDPGMEPDALPAEEGPVDENPDNRE